MLPAVNIPFGEWLPDQADNDNPGLLECQEVFHTAKGYRPVKPFVEFGDAGTNRNINSAFMFRTPEGEGVLLGADDQDVYYGRVISTSRQLDTGGLDTSMTAGAYVNLPRHMAQYDSYVFMSGGKYAQYSSGSGTFGAVSTISGVAAVDPFRIANFMFYTRSDGAVQWSAIGDPTDWPTPLTSDARNKQAGQEFLPHDQGPVVGGIGNEFYGYIFQQRGITKATYVGGDTVFQFEPISKEIGALDIRGIVELGGVVYFASSSGFYALAGSELRPIGHGKVDDYFTQNVNFIAPSLSAQPRGAVFAASDPLRRLVYFGYGDLRDTVSVGVSRILIYNALTQRWSVSIQELRTLTQGIFLPSNSGRDDYRVFATTSDQAAAQTGTPNVATIVSGEGELATGARSTVLGARPIVQGSESYATRVGHRANQNDLVSYTGYAGPNPRTRICDLRVNDRYHRFETQIYGDFETAQGLDIYATAEGRI